MTMKSKNIRRLLGLTLTCSLAFVLLACASPAIQEANQLGHQGQHEAALARLHQAQSESPNDRALRIAVLKQQDEAVNDLSQQAYLARSIGKLEDVQAILKRLEIIAPQHPRTAAIRMEIDRIKRLDRLMADAEGAYKAKAYEKAEVGLRAVLAEDGGNPRAREMLGRIEDLRAQQTRQQSTLSLATSAQPITLEFREAPLKNVFEALSRAANINFVFDKDVRADSKVTLFLKHISVDEAMRVIFSTQQLGYKLLNDSTVMVFPATQQKQRDLLDTVTRTFYLTNADTKQAQNMIRTVAKTRDIFIDERLNMMVVRDTPEVMRLVERLIQGLDLPDPEVMLELEVMEVSSKKLDQIGVGWPESVNFGVPGDTSPVSVGSHLRFYAGNPLAIANLKSTRGSTNLLANPKIRAKNREKAKVLLGEKLPIFTTTSTANVGVSASVSYLDVGLKLEIEPQVQLDNDVTIKVALEVSSITDKVIGPQGSIAYQVGTRQASTTLRLKDGETQILAGLISDNESRSSAGLPGLHELPIAGRLFGSTTDSKDKTEVVLLVTPHIVRNLIQPASSVSLMPSGTEAQPGAMSLQLHDGVSVAGGGAVTGSNRAAAPSTSRAGGMVPVNVVSITGPEEVLPGSAFQVMVRNPGTQVLNATLSFDTSYIELGGPKGQTTGTVSVNVPPGGMVPVLLRAKTGFGPIETAITLDAGATPLTLRIRDPATMETDSPSANASERDESNEPQPPQDR